MFRLLRISVILLSFTLGVSVAAAAPKKKTKPPKKNPGVGKVTPVPAPRQPVLEEESRIARYRVNSLLGLNIVRGSGFLIGTQFGYKIKRSWRVYAGPELNFTLLSGGNLLNVLGSGWVEIPFPSSPNLSLQLGVVAGVGFAENVPQLSSPTNFVAYFDAAIAQELDSLVTIRGQVRPGLVANRFAFMMNFNVGFRLYEKPLAGPRETLENPSLLTEDGICSVR